MRYGNVQTNMSSANKSERIKFFIDQIEKIADLLYEFQNMNLMQILQTFASKEKQMSNETRS